VPVVRAQADAEADAQSDEEADAQTDGCADADADVGADSAACVGAAGAGALRGRLTLRTGWASRHRCGTFVGGGGLDATR
jgi:hypothetical protein